MSGGQRLGEQTTAEQILHTPLRRALRLPGPEDPAIGLLKGIELSFDVAADIALVVSRQTFDRALILPGAVAYAARAWECAVVTCSLAKTVEPFGAIGKCPTPFANYKPLIDISKTATETAGCRDMVVEAHGDLSGAENLVVVRVEYDVVHARARAHEAIPRTDVLEGIADDDGRVAVAVANGAPAIVVVLLQLVDVDLGTKGLVDQLDGRDHV